MMARKYKNQGATFFLSQHLKNNDPRVRAEVAKALGESTLKKSDLLVPLLSDGSPRVRALAAISVGRIGDTTARRAVLAVIQV